MRALDVIDPRLEDTAPPGMLAVREWARPQVASHDKVMLSAVRLVLAHGPAEEAVRLADVTRAELDLATHRVEVHHTGAGPVAVRFADAQVADEFFARLVRRSGAGYELGTDAPTQLELSRGPLGVMAALLLCTVTLAATLAGLPDVVANRPDPPAALVTLARLDWRVATGTGGVLLAVAQVQLLRRLARPPRRMVLRKLTSDISEPAHAS